MRPKTLTIIICFGLMVSCYKPYTADIDSDEKILVVDGMITNEVATYKIHLSYATPFYSNNTRQDVNSANVNVIDNLGNYYPFRESGNGYYLSDSLQFSGHPGSTYTLYIETDDGETYVSDPQFLEPSYYSDTVYAGAEYQETFSRFNTSIVIIRGANIFIDMKSLKGTLPHFRFTSSLVKEYFYNEDSTGHKNAFYCWQTAFNVPEINITHNKYLSDSSAINKHAVFFIADVTSVLGMFYNQGPRQPDLSYKALPTFWYLPFDIVHRILYLNQYSLNNETYLYYKSIYEQYTSEGKLFDPIAVQLTGNIHCTTNPGKQVFGFFEASSVSRSAYIIGFRYSWNDLYDVKRIPYNPLPESDGCRIFIKPPYWVK